MSALLDFSLYLMPLVGWYEPVHTPDSCLDGILYSIPQLFVKLRVLGERLNGFAEGGKPQCDSKQVQACLFAFW